MVNRERIADLRELLAELSDALPELISEASAANASCEKKIDDVLHRLKVESVQNKAEHRDLVRGMARLTEALAAFESRLNALESIHANAPSESSSRKQWFWPR